MRSASAKIAGSGLAAPNAAELRTPSTAAPRPTRASVSASEQSQLLTTTIRRPRPRASARAGSASSNAANTSESSRTRVIASRVTPASASPSSQRAQQHRRAASAELGERGGVAPVGEMAPVVADLGLDRGTGPLLADVDAEPLANDRAHRRCRWLELDKRPVRIDQKRPQPVHATNRQVAKSAVKRPSRTAQTPIPAGTRRRRTSSEETHMNSGKSTTS